ncbi:hypothetical protein [Luteimonas huabeiensis]|uniref:hypothetical protein n=1 Tax=Luteimonas huabeiensis TaxID=1244513 RepID=UPI0004B76F53|nr:hypothetical protein [Luteimonas huabeiensis]
MRKRARWLLLLPACLAAGACAQPAPAAEDEEAQRMSDTVTRGRTVDGYTYTDAPVEARLGPHVFRFPANYYDDQMGPFFDGSLGLRVQWPDLAPMPPGETSRQTMDAFMKAVDYALDYVDRVPIRESLRRTTMRGEYIYEPDDVEYRDPEGRLDLRVAQPEAMGLVRYDVDPDDAAAYARAYEAQWGRPYAPIPGWRKDWYVARDADGEIVTFIQCDTDKITDGLVVEGGELRPSPNPKDRVAQCTHYLILPEDDISVRITYVRVLLPDWKRFESRIKQILQDYRVR